MSSGDTFKKVNYVEFMFTDYIDVDWEKKTELEGIVLCATF